MKKYVYPVIEEEIIELEDIIAESNGEGNQDTSPVGEGGIGDLT